MTPTTTRGGMFLPRTTLSEGDSMRTTTSTRYADCDYCGERYNDEDIARWIREIDIDDEILTICQIPCRGHPDNVAARLADRS